MWRSRVVTDQRSNSRPIIEAELEWLWRWDRRHPRTIFRTGFVPVVNINNLEFGISNEATNLRNYVGQNTNSVFVSTTRTRWTPRARAGRFRYNIFAPGGIDVNPTLGQHVHQNQMEIAFFGGIRTQYIHSAVEFDRNSLQVAYHLNPFYSGESQPLNFGRRRGCILPPTTYPDLTQPRQDYCGVRSSSEKKRSTETELMRTPGSLHTLISDCSYWYKVNVQYLNFDQPAEVGQIEPYGKVSVYSASANRIYEPSVVWEHKSGSDAPSVQKNTNLYDKRKCLVIHSDTNLDTVSVCFKGNVMEYDPYSGDDEIALFSECVDTSPNNKPGQFYHKTFKGADGRLQLSFTVKPCDLDCIKNNLGGNSVNGNCKT